MIHFVYPTQANREDLAVKSRSKRAHFAKAPFPVTKTHLPTGRCVFFYFACRRLAKC